MRCSCQAPPPNRPRRATWRGLLLLALALAPVAASAADRYIRAGASGLNNGSSWDDAWSSFGAVTWARGNTYFVAGGTYNEDVVISTAESGTTWLVVKKANAADNAAAAGWNADYATTQARINGKLSLASGYVEVDGVTGTGTSGHGLKFHLAVSIPGINSVVTLLNGTASPRHLHHLDVEGPGYDYGSTGGDGIYWGSLVAGSKGLHISHCWVHEIPRNGITLGTLVGTSYEDFGLLFESNVVERTGGIGMRHPEIHGQAMQLGYNSPEAYLIIRNNVFRNCAGQALLSWLGGASASEHNVRIHNNLFYTENGTSTVYGLATAGDATTITQRYVPPDPRVGMKDFTNYENIVGSTLSNLTKGTTGIITAVAPGVVTMAGGMSGGVANEAGDAFSFPAASRAAYGLACSIYTSSGNPATNIQIYNNTFVNLHKAQIQLVSPPDPTTNASRNNLWVNNFFTTTAFEPNPANAAYYGNAAGPYQPPDTEASDPLLNAAAQDFRLRSTANAVDAGADLGAAFATDFAGVTRPQGSAWDIGAYEYVPEGTVTYPVTYAANGATRGTAPADQTKLQDQPLLLATNSGGLARDGYAFGGWNTAADGTGTDYAPGAAYQDNAALALYAHWRPQYAITATAASGGKLSPAGVVWVTANADQTFTMGATFGHRLREVFVDEVSVGRPATYTFANVTAAHTIRVTVSHVAIPPDGDDGGCRLGAPEGGLLAALLCLAPLLAYGRRRPGAPAAIPAPTVSHRGRPDPIHCPSGSRTNRPPG